MDFTLFFKWAIITTAGLSGNGARVVKYEELQY